MSMGKINTIIDNWKEIHQLTIGLLDSIPEEHLDFSVAKNMGSLGKQFRHIGDVQICYNEAIKTSKVDFNKYRKDYSIESSREKLNDFLKE